MAKFRIPDLREKVEVLRVSPCDSTASTFPYKNIASALGLANSALAKRLSGTIAVSDSELAALARLFSHVTGLEPHHFRTLNSDEFRNMFGVGEFGMYRRGLANNFRSRQLLRLRVDIAQQYFPLRFSDDDPSNTGTQIIDVMDLLRTNKHARMCIHGPAGFGKTAFLRRWLWEMRNSNEVPFILPLRLHASADSATPIDVAAWFSKYVDALGGSERAKRELRQLLQRRKGVFIVDGFDHLRSNSELAENVACAIETFFAGWECTVVITTRSLGDLRGHFLDFHTFRIAPIESDDFDAFLKTVNARRPQKIREFLRPLGDASNPFMILTALAFTDWGPEAKDMPPHDANIGSPYALMDRAVDTLLEPRSDPDRSYPLKYLQMHQVAKMRKDILDMIIEDWSRSSQPCRISVERLHGYFNDAASPYNMLLEREEMTQGEIFQYVVPTGICLERSNTDPRAHSSYVFVHDKIQEYFFARKLLQHIARGDPSPFHHEYYSLEILELLGGALGEQHINQLLTWLIDPAMKLMVRKGAASALGYITNPAWRDSVFGRLSKLFSVAGDVGVDGRIAESLQRLGDMHAHARFVARLGDYPLVIRAIDELWRPLTFEMDIREKIRFDTPTSGTLWELLLTSPNASVRKHALILLSRSQLPPTPTVIARYFRHEAAILCKALATGTPDLVDLGDVVRSLLYSAEVLARFGTAEEALWVYTFRKQLSGYNGDLKLSPLLDHLENTYNRLSRRHWPPRRGRNSNGRPEAEFRVFLVRHGETDANVIGKFLGRTGVTPLNELGRAQALAVAQELSRRLRAKADHVLLHCSPAQRARETASIVGKLLTVEPTCDDDLHELDLGAWSGRVKDEVAALDTIKYDHWRANKWLSAPRGGETMFDVKYRICRALRRCMQEQEGKATTLIMVSHFHAIQALYAQLEGRDDLRPDNCALTSFFWSMGQWRMEECNYTDHLKAAGYSAVSYA